MASAAQIEAPARSLDWDLPVAMKAYPDRVGRHFGLTASGRRRVQFPSPSQPHSENATMATFDEKGISRVDGQPSDWDLINV